MRRSTKTRPERGAPSAQAAGPEETGLAHIRERLAGLAATGEGATLPGSVLTLDHPALAHPQVQSLCTAFGLSAFEAQMLLLALGVELVPEIARLCADCHGDGDRRHATFRLAIALFPGSEWRSLTPAGALRFWDLVAVDPAAGLLDAPVRLSEFALHWLCGVASRERSLMDWLDPLDDRVADDLSPSHAAIARQATTVLCNGEGGTAIVLRSLDSDDTMRIARAVAAAIGRPLDRLRGDAVMSAGPARTTLLKAIRREQTLCPSVLLLELGEADETAERLAAVVAFLRDLAPAAVIVSTPARFALPGARQVSYDVGRPTRAEQDMLWSDRLGAEAAPLSDLLGGFDLRRSDIDAAFRAASAARAVAGGGAWRSHVGAACRARLRNALDPFVQRLPVTATLDDLVLPPLQHDQLSRIVQDVRHHRTVLQKWLESGGSTRGLGLCALFAGPAGSGKTTAAEALAQALDLDLCRIDLSAVISKYIGETEKQLNRVFDAAEGGASLLLFDESDALFGKRTEVRDSHDRYANQEISFLLQKLETYRGVAVLTSNLADALDPAFLRRFRYAVEFPLPGPAQREALWRKILGRVAAAETLDFARLARLNLPGGHINNIALQAAFLAASDDGTVTMDHIHRAAAAEYRKLHRTLTEEEFGL